MLEEIYQAWWRPYSALQFAVRSLSRAAENSLENMAAVKLIKSYTDIKSNLYKSYFKSICKYVYFWCFCGFITDKIFIKEKKKKGQ